MPYILALIVKPVSSGGASPWTLFCLHSETAWEKGNWKGRKQGTKEGETRRGREIIRFLVIACYICAAQAATVLDTWLTPRGVKRSTNATGQTTLPSFWRDCFSLASTTSFYFLNIHHDSLTIETVNEAVWGHQSRLKTDRVLVLDWVVRGACACVSVQYLWCACAWTCVCLFRQEIIKEWFIKVKNKWKWAFN